MKRLLTVLSIAIVLTVSASALLPVTNLVSGTQVAYAEEVVGPPAPAASGGTEAPSAAASIPTTPSKADSSLLESGMAFVITGVMSWCAYLLGIAALTLDNAVYFTVVTMGGFVNELSAIGVTWRILRDIGNIALLFGFIAIGITTILNVEWYGGGYKLLPKLLIAAVALNFSLFAAEAVIDAGNLFATQFYTQINGGKLASPIDLSSSGPSVSDQIGNAGLSNKVLAALGLQKIYGAALSYDGAFTASTMIIVGLLGIMLFLIAAFVFFSLAFVLVSRFIALVFIMIFSPIGVAGFAIPKLENLASQWWSQLFKQTATAPILLLGLYIALAIITDAKFLTGLSVTSDGFGAALDNKNLPALVGMLLAFFVAMGLLLGVTMLSKRLGAFGADSAMKFGGMASFGAVAWAGRATFGLGGSALASRRMQSLARRGGVGGLALKFGVGTGKVLRNRTYDLRNIPGITKVPGSIGVDIGKASKYTAKDLVDQTEFSRYGLKPIRELFEASAAEREKAGREMDFKDAQSVLAEAQMYRAAGADLSVEEEATVKNAEDLMKGELSKMSTKQLEELDGIKNGVEELVRNLTPQQFEALMKSDKLTDKQKDNIRDTRYRRFDEILKNYNPADSAVEDGKIRDELKKLSKGELEGVPPEFIQNDNFVRLLSDKQRDSITDSKERTAAEKERVRKWSATGRVEDAFDDPSRGPKEAAKMIKDLTPAQQAKLSKKLLLDPDIINKFSVGTLTALQDEKILTTKDIDTIGDNIRMGAGSSSLRDHIDGGGFGASYWAKS